MSEDVYLVPAFLTSPVRVARDCYYYRESHTWVRVEGNQATVGISDMLRYRSEEGAVLEQKPVGTGLHQSDEFALWETIKAIIPLYSPVTGTIVGNNRALRDKPDLPLQDPYGEGWIARLALNNWDRDRPQLMTPEEYHALVKFEVTGEKDEPTA